MRKHQTTMKDVIRMACYRNGMTQEVMCRKTGISNATATRHMGDGKWSREQIKEMHRFLHFTPEEMQIYFEGR